MTRHIENHRVTSEDLLRFHAIPPEIDEEVKPGQPLRWGTVLFNPAEFQFHDRARRLCVIGQDNKFKRKHRTEP